MYDLPDHPALAKIVDTGWRLAARLDRWPAWLAAALAIVLGAKLFLIGMAGSTLPFWDQWSAEGERLFLPYLHGRLDAARLLEPHNEHRMMFTRLASIGLLELTGGWNTLAEMVVNALLHVAVLAGILYVLRRSTLWLAPGLTCLIVVALFAVPFAIENTLWGTQSQFSLLAGLSVLGIVLLIGTDALSAGWWLGFVAACLSYLNMASGLLAPLAAALVLAGQMAVGARPRRAREIGAILLLLAATGGLALCNVTIARHAMLKAHTIVEFAFAFSRAAGWPIRFPLLAPLILNAPGLVLVGLALRRRLSVSDPRWRVVALVLWAGLQGVSTAYARALTPDASRYLDGFALAVLFNFAAALQLREDAAMRRGERIVTLGNAAWLATVGAFLIVQAVIVSNRMGWLITLAPARAEAIDDYLRTRDVRTLDRPFLHVPFPAEERAHWAALLGHAEIRGLLPATLGVSERDREYARHLLRLRGGLRLGEESFRKPAIYGGGLIAAAGTSLLFLLLVLGEERRRSERADAP